MRLLTTIEHTGTTYVKGPLMTRHGEYLREQHICAHALRRAKKAEQVFTTWRDPFRVAASWWNRGSPDVVKWHTQWEDYGRLLTLAPVVFVVGGPREQHGYTFGPEPLNSHPDKFGLHAALDTGDLGYYHEHVPREWTRFAHEMVAGQLPRPAL